MQISIGPSLVFWSCIANAFLLPRDTTDWASLQCPEDPDSILPTPTYGDADGIFSVCTEKIINAPAELVYNALIDFGNYHSWNSFVIDVTLPEDVTQTPDDVYTGMPMTFTSTGLIPLINTTSYETVTVLDSDSESEYRLAAWAVLEFSEHPNILVNQGGGMTRYISYETYYHAVFGVPLLALRQVLQEQFEQQGQDLLNYVESLV